MALKKAPSSPIAFRRLLPAVALPIAVGAVVLALAADLPASTRVKPAKGKLLVAAADLRDPNFSRTVVFLLRYDETGAMGLIVNRPTEYRLSRVLPKMEGLRGRRDSLYRGGPVQPDNFLLLVRSEEPLEDSHAVIDGVLVSESADLLEAILAGSEEIEFRLFAGYAGWGPGQLDNELERGDWHVVQGEASLVFDSNPSELWRALVPRSGREWTRALPAERPVPAPLLVQSR